jgi:predicted dehydrogenase
LAAAEFDAAYIANNSTEHATTTIAALEAGKPGLCEKPLALAAAEGERVMAAGRRTGTLCMEGIWTPFLSAYRRFFQLARPKLYGEPTHLYADFGYPIGAGSAPHSSEAGSVLLDKGGYPIGLALKVFGPIERVEAECSVTGEGIDRSAYVLLRHPGGGHSQLCVFSSALMLNASAPACAGGLIRLEEFLIGAQTLSQRGMAPQGVSERVASGLQEPRHRVRAKLREVHFFRRLARELPRSSSEHHSHGPDKYLPQLSHFLTLLRTRARESDVTPLEPSLNILRIIDEARAAARRGNIRA